MIMMRIFLLLAIIFPLTFTSSIVADDDYYELWESQQTVDNYKTWTINFSQEIDERSIHSSRIYVLNEFNRIIPTSIKLLEDKKSISVTPIQMYLSNQRYELIIKDLRSVENEILSPAVKMPFIVKRERADTTSSSSREEQQASEPSPSREVTQTNNDSQNSNEQTSSTPTNRTQQNEDAIKDIKVDLNSLVATVTVTTSDEVALVKLDGKVMHYAGNNVYQLSKAGLNRTQSFTVEAFGTHNSNSLLERKQHQVR